MFSLNMPQASAQNENDDPENALPQIHRVVFVWETEFEYGRSGFKYPRRQLSDRDVGPWDLNQEVTFFMIFAHDICLLSYQLYSTSLETSITHMFQTFGSLNLCCPESPF